MPYTAAQLIAAYSAANVGVAPDGATTALLTSYATQTQTGQMSDATALGLVINSADNTTAVANTAYQFFTGKTPGQAGLAFLVNSPTNPTDLNDPYYAAFNIENRYMNFAANLGLIGDGSANFAATYGPLTFTATVSALYETIIGSSYATAAGINVANALADIGGRQAAFTQTARERGLITASSTATQIDLATKAVLVGYLLVEGMKADVGVYAAGSNNLTQALIGGTAQYNVNLLTTYSPLGGGTGSPVPGASTSANLTTAGDTIVGGTANDTYAGVIYTDTPASSTFNLIDTINGGGGADTLNLAVQKLGGGVAGNATVPGASLTSIETVNIRATSTTVGDITTVSAASFSGTTAVNSDRSTNTVTVTNLAAGASGGVIGDGATVNGAFNFGYAATGGPAVLNLSGGTRGTSAINLATAASSLTVNSAGSAANTTGFISVGGATSLAINATASLNAQGFTGFTGPNASITVSGAAAPVAATTTVSAAPAVNLGFIEATVATVSAAGLTGGGVWAGIGANAGLNFTGSGQADMVNVTGGSTFTGTINGAGGTDMVQFNLGADLSAANGAKFTSFETLAVTNAGGAATLQSYNTANIAGITVHQALASTGSVQLTGLASGAQVVASGNLAGTNAAGALSLMLANATGGADSVTLTLNNAASPSGTLPASGVVVSSLGLGGTVAGQVETLNIVSAGAITSAYNSVTLQASGAGPNFADPNSIVVTGSQGLNLITGALGHNLSVNAAGATGGLNFSSAAGGAVAVTVIGTGVNDTITLGGAGQTATVLGGVGADAIIITAGMGAVNVSYTAANQSTLDLTGTPGTSGASTPNIGTMDFIQGFRTGTDKLGVSSAGVTGFNTGIADKGAAANAAAVTALLATANFYSNGISTLKAAQFDYAGGTMLVADANNNGVYDGGDMVIFLAGIANVAVGDLN